MSGSAGRPEPARSAQPDQVVEVVAGQIADDDRGDLYDVEAHIAAGGGQERGVDDRGASSVGSTTSHAPSTSASATAWKSIGASPGA